MLGEHASPLCGGLIVIDAALRIGRAVPSVGITLLHGRQGLFLVVMDGKVEDEQRVAARGVGLDIGILAVLGIRLSRTARPSERLAGMLVDGPLRPWGHRDINKAVGSDVVGTESQLVGEAVAAREARVRSIAIVRTAQRRQRAMGGLGDEGEVHLRLE